MNGLWLLPSRRRPESLTAFFKAAVDTGMKTGGLVLIQKDEFDDLKDLYTAIQLPDGWGWWTTDGEGYTP